MSRTATIGRVRADGRVIGELHAEEPLLRRALCAGMVLGVMGGPNVVAYVDREHARDTRGRRPRPCEACLEFAPPAWRRWFRRTGRIGRPPVHPGARLRSDFLHGALPEQRATGAKPPQHRWCDNCSRTGLVQVDPSGPAVKCGRCGGRGLYVPRRRRAA